MITPPPPPIDREKVREHFERQLAELEAEQKNQASINLIRKHRMPQTETQEHQVTIRAAEYSGAAHAVTKEGIEVRVGQIWRDLDKRMANRTVKVLAVDVTTGKAEVEGQLTGQRTKLSVRRMHKSATGWALVSDPKASKP